MRFLWSHLSQPMLGHGELTGKLGDIYFGAFALAIAIQCAVFAGVFSCQYASIRVAFL